MRRDAHPGPTAPPQDGTQGPPAGPAEAAPVPVRLRADRHGGVVESEATGGYLRLDARGRWIAWRHEGRRHRRSLCGDVYTGEAPGERRPPGEADAVHDAVAREAARLADALDAGTPPVEGAPGARAALRVLLRRAAAFDARAMAGETARARAAYPQGVAILPPHRYRDVVVDVALGCPNARCTFCAFYAGRPFRPLDDAEFEGHLRAVLDLWAEALPATDGVFLGAASGASIPDATLRRRLARVREALGQRTRGVAAFLDPDHAPARDAGRWEALREEGLLDLTVGLETGHPPLRRAVGKSDDLARFARVVRAARDGGLRSSVTVLLGLGGAEHAEVHREATRRAILALGLLPDDRVYLATLEGSMPPARLAGERVAWRRALEDATPARVVPYPASDFVAWS